MSGWGNITRVAGTGTAGAGGDDGPATDAQLRGPGAVAILADGFLFADVSNHEIRKVSASGTITRVAGTGTAGAGGDDGPATDAQLQSPSAVAVTADGGFLIADSASNRIRLVAPA